METFKTQLKRYAPVIIFVLPILCLLFIFRKVIFLGYFFGNGDIIFNFFEYFNYFAHGGNIISQQLLSGFPVLVSVAGVWFYPLNRLVLWLFNPFTAYKIIDIGNILLAYLCTYFYARKIKFSHIYAVCA